MRKHVCAETVNRVCIGGSYKTGLSPNSIIWVASYTSFVSRKFGGNFENSNTLVAQNMFFSYFLASYSLDRFVSVSNESLFFTNLLKHHFA